MHRGPCGKYKSNVSEEVLLSTIHMSLWFTVRPFPYVELLRTVLDVGLNREVAGRAFRRREVTGSGGEEPGSIPGTALTRGAAQLSQGRPKVARSRTPAAAEMAAQVAANCSGGVDDTRASGGAARAEGCGAVLS